MGKAGERQRKVKVDVLQKRVKPIQKVKKSKTQEPSRFVSKDLTKPKFKVDKERSQKTVLFKRFLMEYKKKETDFIKKNKLSKQQKRRFLNKSALLRSKKFKAYEADPNRLINFDEFGEVLNQMDKAEEPKTDHKVSNKKLYKNQIHDLKIMKEIKNHPVFAKNPIEALKTHLRNSLAK